MSSYSGYLTRLKKNEVIIVGTNANGLHFGGAARQAFDNFGLEWGVSEGLSGKAYAFPTLDMDMKPVSNTELKASRLKLYRCANEHPELTFYLTKVGCGIAGMDEVRVKKLFKNAPENVMRPEGW